MPEASSTAYSAINSSSHSPAFLLTPQTLPSPQPGHAPPKFSSTQHAWPADSGDPQFANMLDFELLHHYCTSTYATMSNVPAQRSVTKFVFPKIGFKHPFVLRAILAFSALHMAHNRPEEREFYTQQAIVYHGTASREAAGLVTNLNDENSTPVFTFSIFTFYFIMALPQRKGARLFPQYEGIADWLRYFRGIRTIIAESNGSLRNGELGAIFAAGRKRMEAWMEATQETSRLRELEALFAQLRPKMSDPEEVAAYEEAIRNLRQSYNETDHAPRVDGWEISGVFYWCFRAPEKYLEALLDKKQFALVIFAWFCVMLKQLEGLWWMTGWTQHLIEKIWGLLSEEFRLWIRWPIEEIGWVPPS